MPFKLGRLFSVLILMGILFAKKHKVHVFEKLLYLL